MSELVDEGAPFFFATHEPPTASAIDDDVYLTVTTSLPGDPGKVETVDIILSLEYAKHAVVQLSRAVTQAASNEAR